MAANFSLKAPALQIGTATLDAAELLAASAALVFTPSAMNLELQGASLKAGSFDEQSAGSAAIGVDLRAQQLVLTRSNDTWLPGGRLAFNAYSARGLAGSFGILALRAGRPPARSTHFGASMTGAANILAQRESWNPFFLWLAARPAGEVAAAIGRACPLRPEDLPKTMNEWAWEREESDQAWRRSMLWDCIFASALK